MSDAKSISVVIAADEANGIGKGNALPWHLPDELQHFKTLTVGRTVVMGRKTFDSIGKALPRRQNIVVSTQKGFVAPGCAVATSIEEALQIAASDEVVFIGGASLLNACLHMAHTVHLTRVHADFACDVVLKGLQIADFAVQEMVHHAADAKHAVAFTMYRLVRV